MVAFGTIHILSLEEGIANLSPSTPLPSENTAFSYVFVADKAFPLSTYMMKPFPKKNEKLTDDERIFNYRLSRTRRVIKNTFGIMGTKWQILNSCISCPLKNAEQIVKALVCLHNFMMTCGRTEYCPSELVNTERNSGEVQTGAWRDSFQIIFHRLGRVGANRSSRIVYGMRKYLMQYFVSEIDKQQAPWQYKRALRGYFINL